jgi:hypothetical protein
MCIHKCFAHVGHIPQELFKRIRHDFGQVGQLKRAVSHHLVKKLHIEGSVYFPVDVLAIRRHRTQAITLLPVCA